jgi:acetylornithine deacetylase
MRSATDILRELVSIPSVSSMSNRPLIEAAARMLEGSGWTTRQFPYRDAGGVEKVNLIARPGHQAALTHADLAFVCHTDTVPFIPEAWLGATVLEERSGFLHGCGACDVKGSLAGILAAVFQTEAVGIDDSVALILTADEEVGCVGATHLLAEPVLRARTVIVCEPTSLRPGVAGKGYGLAEVRVVGKEAHSAFPRQGSSAIYAAAKMMLAIESNKHTAASNELFDPPWTTFNVGTVHGGTAKNIVPGECHFLVEWRPIPDVDPAAAAGWLKNLAERTQHENPGCAVYVDIRRAEPGFAYSPDSPLVRTLSARFGRQPTGISFGSEATRFAKVADEVVVLGPGDMHTAHSDRECIASAELEAWTDCVRSLLTR